MGAQELELAATLGMSRRLFQCAVLNPAALTIDTRQRHGLTWGDLNTSKARPCKVVRPQTFSGSIGFHSLLLALRQGWLGCRCVQWPPRVVVFENYVS